MAYNGAGLFARLYNFVSDRNAAIKIRADRMDAEMDGFATGLSNCITRDGQTTITANIPFNGKRLTGVGDATAETDALNRQVADERYAAAGATIINGTIVQSRSSNAETFAVKTVAGNDPTTADPVLFAFQTGSGTTAIRRVTAALSLVVSSGSTLGAANSVPFRLWLVAADDGGTVRLGVVKTVSGTDILTLGEWQTYSSTAEGGAGAADSAQVIYSGTAFTSKYIALVGFSDWDSGLATAGTWGTAPTRTITFGPGVPRPGQPTGNTRHVVLPTTFTSASTGAFVDVTGLSTSITPASAANLVLATPRICMSSDTAGSGGGAALIRGSTNIGGGTGASNRPSVFASFTRTTDSNSSNCLTALVLDAPGATSSTTYKIQAVGENGATIYVNRTRSDSDLVGLGRQSSSLTLQEIMA